ncbi:NAD(P)H-binding protein [Tessaracoccus sp. Z1128]
MSIVITAATGQLGNLVVQSLLARGVRADDIVATGRALDRLAALRSQGVRTAVLDYNNPADGVINEGDTVLLISGSEVGQRIAQHGNVIAAAKAAGAARIVYTSVVGADSTSLLVAPEHVATEQLLRDSGLTYTFLRNGWYHENYQPTLEQARQAGVVVSSAGNGLVSSASRADYAEAAAAALIGDGQDNAVYELGGDTAWTMRDLVNTFAEVLGQPVSLKEVNIDEHASILREAGLDDGTIGFITTLDTNTADDTLLVTTGDLSRLIGRPTTPIDDAVRSWARGIA